MIRTLVVDDDAMTLAIHRQFLERLSEFAVVGVVTSGTDALQMVERLLPDLVLLDIYLLDMSGVEVLRQLRATGRTPVDVIAVTSAKDVEMVRTALRLGITHYIVKPFTFSSFRQRLESYAAARSRLSVARELEQRDIDKILGLLRIAGEESLPKNIAAPTLAIVTSVLREAGGEGISASRLADKAGVSPNVARRYLNFLAQAGVVELTPRYGVVGRPEHIYRLSAEVSFSAG